MAQMGAEPFAKVLAERPDVDIIVSGRSYDPAPHAGFCMLHGIDPGVYWHMGKIVECGADCAEPKGRVILATIRKRQLRPRADEPGRALHAAVGRRAHALREDAARPAVRPRRRAGPPTSARYEALDDRRVRVSGSVLPAHRASTA